MNAVLPPRALEAYFDRIGLARRPVSSAADIAALITAHRRAIAFENLDIRLGRPIRIDSESVFDKLVTRRRGGYCFEQNRLLADMLDALGFELRPLLARVRLGPAGGPPPPRSHVLLRAMIAGRPWIVDAGFGGSDLPPLPLEDGAQADTADGASHRLRHIGPDGTLEGAWLLERAGPVAATDGRAAAHGDWQAQYSFDLAHVAPHDLEQGNHWTSTRPGERFTSLHIASIPLPDGFAAMTDRMLNLYRGGETSRREIVDAADYAATLQTIFGLAFSLEEAQALPLFKD